jgi:hypothetical protein
MGTEWFNPEHIVAEWKVLTAAPLLTIGLVIATLAVGYIVARWRYGGTIEQLKERLELRDDQIADYQDKLQGASPEQAKARLDALEMLVDRLRPRELSDSERASLLASLQVKPSNIEIVLDAAAVQSRKFHGQLVEAFRDAGWTVANPVVHGPGAHPRSGLGVSATKGRAHR